jgi:hypothetical protein
LAPACFALGANVFANYEGGTVRVILKSVAAVLFHPTWIRLAFKLTMRIP